MSSLGEAMPLLLRHWEEVEPFHDIRPEPNPESIKALSEAGMLQVFSAREDGVLIGYEAFIVSYHMHYANSKRAYQDMIYIVPEKRGPVAIGLLDFSDKCLAEQDVQIVIRAEKRASPYGPLLQRSGHDHHENLWIKRLDKPAKRSNVVQLPRLRKAATYDSIPDVPESLLQFLAWYFEGGGIKLRPPQDGILHQQRPGTRATSIVLFRDGRRQVELIIFGPGSSIPFHRHDFVDTIEVMLSGALDLFVDGKLVSCLRQPLSNGVSRDALKFLPIAAGCSHGGQAGDMGGAFLSVQEWKIDPSHVGIEWQDHNNRSFAQGG